VPVYEYRCRKCGQTRDSQLRDDVQVCACGGLSKRQFHANIKAGFIPHFNHAVGAHVTSDRHFSDLLKVRSEQNTIATGTEHNYSRVDPGDMPEPSRDSSIFETRDKLLRDTGQVGAPTTSIHV
jgi:putative FmdB family regulatory protein